MKNRLSAVAVSVDDHPVAVFGKAFFPRDTGAGQKQMSERLLVTALRSIERIEMLARNDEQMHGRLRADIVENDADVILVNALSWNFARIDAAEYAVFLAHTDRIIKA